MEWVQKSARSSVAKKLKIKNQGMCGRKTQRNMIYLPQRHTMRGSVDLVQQSSGGRQLYFSMLVLNLKDAGCNVFQFYDFAFYAG